MLLTVRNLYALMAAEATVDWPKVPEQCRAGKRPGEKHALACSRLGPGDDFVKPVYG